MSGHWHPLGWAVWVHLEVLFVHLYFFLFMVYCFWLLILWSLSLSLFSTPWLNEKSKITIPKRPAPVPTHPTKLKYIYKKSLTGSLGSKRHPKNWRSLFFLIFMLIPHPPPPPRKFLIVTPKSNHIHYVFLKKTRTLRSLNRAPSRTVEIVAVRVMCISSPLMPNTLPAGTLSKGQRCEPFFFFF